MELPSLVSDKIHHAKALDDLYNREHYQKLDRLELLAFRRQELQVLAHSTLVVFRLHMLVLVVRLGSFDFSVYFIWYSESIDTIREVVLQSIHFLVIPDSTEDSVMLFFLLYPYLFWHLPIPLE